jgi:hypothetical protein
VAVITKAPEAPRAIGDPAIGSESVSLFPLRAFSLILLLVVALCTFGLFDAVKQNGTLLWSFLGAAAILLAWNVILFVSAVRTHRTFTLEILLRKQHYLQACAQGSVLLYWGWHWREVYDSAYLIAAQLMFAYAFDMLLCWSRRDVYTMGFGPFPIVFSINLFLWFKPDWFYLQFAMVALGFAAKEFIRWNRDGRRAHIFNPSSFPLAVFSLGLILTGTSDITWAHDIATTQFYPPHIYLMLFLVGLPGQFFFGVTSMTMAAVVTTYVFGLLYFAATGTYFFFDSYIPIAVFLGMHLLFTDPSTSPRTELGRLAFGALYGLSTVALYAVLGNLGAPTVYDKLLQVPILNLSVRLIDRAARSKMLQTFDPAAVGRSLTPSRRNLAYMSVWAIVFAVMSAAHGVGDHHPGQSVQFWQRACQDDRPYACGYLTTLQSTFCRGGSGWACNELGILQADVWRDRVKTAAAFRVGCDRGFQPACLNVVRAADTDDTFATGPPTLVDYPIILRASKGPITDLRPSAIYARACTAGWSDTCGRVAPSGRD